MADPHPIDLPPDRYFGPDARQKEAALELFETVADLPLICPHGHVEPQLFADPDYTFGNPATLLIVPDHYIFRMLRSQGIPLESLGVPRRDGGPVESDPRRIWQIFADNFHLFRGTPTGMWLTQELHDVFWRHHQTDRPHRPGNLRSPGGATGPTGLQTPRHV
jgi:glucuronate isomerase